MSHNRTHLKAFSLMELTLVIIVIGIILAGIIASDAIIGKAKISTARSLTSSSPINSVPGLAFWFESSQNNSFISTEADNDKSLSAWYDNSITVNKNNASQLNSANKPIYSNTINRIHAVKFDGSSSYFTVNGSFLNNNDYTIFVVEKRLGNKSNNYFIGDSSIATINQNLLLGYSANDKVIHSQAGSNSYISRVLNYEDSAEKPKFFTFTQSSTGKKTYINGILAGQSNDAAQLSNISTLTIGKGYNGEIGELIAFSRSLSNSERQEIEAYLSKKWSIKNYSGTSCLTGKVGNSGCDVITGHWVFESMVYAGYSGKYSAPDWYSTLTCDASHDGAYAYGDGVAAPVTGSIWTTSPSADLNAWYECYCNTSPSCTVSGCGSLGLGDGATSLALYKCVYN